MLVLRLVRTHKNETPRLYAILVCLRLACYRRCRPKPIPIAIIITTTRLRTRHLHLRLPRLHHHPLLLVVIECSVGLSCWS